MIELVGRPVFSVGAADYRWEDLVIAASVWGDWERLRQRTGEGLACLQKWQEDEGFEDEIAAAAQDFRCARGLIGTQELEGWLERWGLTADDWVDAITASFLRAAWSANLDDLVRMFPPPDEDIRDAINVEGICAGDFARWSWDLAARAAVHDRASSENRPAAGPATDAASPLGDAPSSSAISAATGLSREMVQSALGRIVELERRYRQYREAALTSAAIDHEVRAHTADWIRLDRQFLSFPHEQQAREAGLCIKDDGQSMDAVAAETHQEARREELYLEDISAPDRSRFLAAQKGDLVGPIADGNAFTMSLLLDKVPPSRDDPRVLARAEEAILHRLIDQEIGDRVKWHERF